MYIVGKLWKFKLILVVFFYFYVIIVKYYYMGREIKKVKNRCWYIMYLVVLKEFFFYSVWYDGM